MENSASRALGERRGVHFSAARVDVVSADVDLLVVGMFRPGCAAHGDDGAARLDAALHGVLGKLREGGIFGGGLDEVLILSALPLPLRARALMVVGMGACGEADPAMIGRQTGLALSAALRMGVGSAACLLATSEWQIPHERTGEAGSAMMAGALAAIERHVWPPGRRIQWIFDIGAPAPAGERLAEAFRRTLATAPPDM